jgi:hypothetical protein
MANYDQVFWLNVTNAVLGLVTLACVLVIGYASLKEIRSRAGKASTTVKTDDHAFVVTGLGITMADGGKVSDDDEMLVVTENGIESVKKSDISGKKKLSEDVSR